MPIIEKKSRLAHILLVEESAPQSRYAKQPQSLNPNSNKHTNEINIGHKFNQNQCCADADDWKEISFGTRQRLTNPHFSGRTKNQHQNLGVQNSHSLNPNSNKQTRSISDQNLIKTNVVLMPMIEKKSRLAHVRG